ncbi:MAG: ABC transporter permease [Ktedonobacteraceae bacterium]
MAKNVLPSATAQQAEPEKAKGRGAFWSNVTRILLRRREASIIIVAIALVTYFQVSNQNFLSQDNIRTLSQFAAETAIISAGMVMLLICGEIDLSVGMVFALAPFIMYFTNQAGVPLWVGLVFGVLAGAAITYFTNQAGVPLWMAFILGLLVVVGITYFTILGGLPLWIGLIFGLLVSAGVGLINGLVTVLLKVPSFITTLGTLFLVNGFTLTFSGAFPANTPPAGVFNQVFGNSPYSEIIWAIAIAIVLQTILSYTRWGLHTVATGGNLHGANETGVSVNRVKIGNFMLASVLAGFAGILESFRITTIDPNQGGNSIMFMAVAGAVIGGTSLMGGLGTVAGAFLGVLVLSILQDGFTLLGVSAFTFFMILGGAILIAMILNVRLQLLREAGRQ